jgi:hypothetical protein
LNFNGGNIVQSNNDDLLLTTFDNDGIVSSSVGMSPDSTLTRIEQWSSQDSNSWTTSDWSTGTYTIQAGLGAVVFTGATAIIDFVDSLNGVGHIFFSVNGGPQLVWDGSSAGGGTITFYTPTLPSTDPTTVTSFEYFYSYKSGFEIDYDSNEVNIYANDADINLETTNQQDITITSSRDATLIGYGAVSLTNYSNNDGVSITTNANGTLNQWNFDESGNLILAGGESVIRSVANSSLDPLNPNVSTMILTPSAGYSSQSLVLDPTAPGHIHLRAPGANIDEPLANIFLGGETSSFEVGYHNGSAPNAFIHSGGNTWRFLNNGNLVFPGSDFNGDPI